MKKILPIIIIFLTTVSFAQDIHFSQYNMSPLTLNPAMTGFFNGCYRLAANYRSQWGSIGDPYQTVSASVDFTAFKGTLKNDYLGVGAMFYRDAAGRSNFGTTTYNFSIAYAKGLDRRGTNLIAVGLQGGLFQRGMDLEGLIFDSQYDGLNGDPNLPSYETINENLMLVDAGAGVLGFFQPSDNFNFYLGASYTHVTQPDVSMMAAEEILYARTTASGGANIHFSDQFALVPTFYLQMQGPSREIDGGAFFKFKLDNYRDEETSVSFGLLGRFADPLFDAILLAARMDYKTLSIGLSYDINVSELTKASNLRGGPEVALMYTGKCSSGGKGRIYCPRF